MSLLLVACLWLLVAVVGGWLVGKVLDVVGLDPLGPTQGAPHCDLAAFPPAARSELLASLEAAGASGRDGQAGRSRTTTLPARHLHAVPAVYSDGAQDQLTKSFDIVADALAARAFDRDDVA